MTAPSLLAVIFDLDGTLVDSRLDFAAMRRELEAPPGSVRYATLPVGRRRQDTLDYISFS